MTTTVREETVQSTLNKSDLTDTADLLAHINAGFALSIVKVTVVGATSLAAQDVTSFDTIDNATVVGISPALVASDGARLPAIGNVISLRVTAGTADVGDRIISDAGGTPAAKAALAAGVATLSDDGTTLTFEAAVTAYVLVYQPRAEGMTDSFPVAAP